MTDIEELVGGKGSDVLVGSSVPNIIDGGPGDDSLSGLAYHGELSGDVGNDFANGGSDSDACDTETETACESDLEPDL